MERPKGVRDPDLENQAMTRELCSAATGARSGTFLPTGGNRRTKGGICMSSRAEALGRYVACGLALPLVALAADPVGGFFFFSSRRRQTSFDCDWSSDVCSSDLLQRSVRHVAVDATRMQ